jgi:hypothetical protein
VFIPVLVLGVFNLAVQRVDYFLRSNILSKLESIVYANSQFITTAIFKPAEIAAFCGIANWFMAADIAKLTLVYPFRHGLTPANIMIKATFES